VLTTCLEGWVARWVGDRVGGRVGGWLWRNGKLRLISAKVEVEAELGNASKDNLRLPSSTPSNGMRCSGHPGIHET